MNNATNSEARLESVLNQVRVLKAKYDERAEVTGENFNVFSILDRESDEVKTHSAIIAELLNPQGSHSQGTLFLKLFLEKLLEGEIPKLKCGKDGLSDEYLKKFEVGVEVSFEKKDEKGEMKRSQIDILIESDDVCIVIENKIYAEDQKRQLGRYYEYALDTGKKRGIIYLTLLGDEPGEFTLYGKPEEFYGEDKIPLCRKLPEDTVICLSYKEFIVTWVNNCIKEVVRIPQIRETLHQYQMLLKELIGQPINRRYAMALKDILLEDKNFNLIPGLEAALSYAQTDLQFKFWSELKNQLESPEVQKDLNNKVKNLRYEVHLTNLRIDKKEETTKECIRERPRGQSPGLTFNFSEENGKHEIVFRITHDGNWDRLYYGFVLCEKGGDKKVAINKAEHEEYLKKYEIYDAAKGGWEDGWLAYKYFKKPKIDSIDCESVEKYNRMLVNRLVKDVCEVIKKISEQERGAAT